MTHEDERARREREVIEFKLNGDTVSAFAGETIIQAAARHGVDIPHLCYKEGYRPDGNCRACVVEIKGEARPRALVLPPAGQGHGGVEQQPRAVHSQKMVLELLMSDVPKDDLKPGANELFHWAGELGVTRSRFHMRSQPADDISIRR
jgi:formate dehydrogenase major subunit